MQRLISLLEGVTTISDIGLDVPIQSVSADSRHVLPGSAFVAIPGLTEDGNLYIPDAIDRGAAVIISDGGSRANVKTPLIRVDDPRRALSRIAANFYGHPSRELTMIGITGTNGKTTVSYLLNSILERYELQTGVMGTLGIHAPGMEAKSALTTPDSLDLHKTLRLLADGNVTHVVMEVSSHALKLNRVDDLEFDAAVFTNLSQDHLDFHGTMENYFEAKARLFRMLPAGSNAILNSADARFDTLKNITKAEITSYAVNGDADITYNEWGMSGGGITGTLRLGKEEVSVNSPLMGVHNLENILAAAATAWSMGIPASTIERGIEACTLVPGRSERFLLKNGALVVVDYAHTPDAYHKLFSSLRTLLPISGRLFVIFGCGGDRDHDKRPLMAEAAEVYAHRILVTPDNPRTESIASINKDIAAGFEGDRHTFHDDRAEAIRQAVEELQEGDILAVVGKGRENCQIVGTERIPYSDIKVVEKIIEEEQEK